MSKDCAAAIIILSIIVMLMACNAPFLAPAPTLERTATSTATPTLTNTPTPVVVVVTATPAPTPTPDIAALKVLPDARAVYWIIAEEFGPDIQVSQHYGIMPEESFYVLFMTKDGDMLIAQIRADVAAGKWMLLDTVPVPTEEGGPDRETRR